MSTEPTTTPQTPAAPAATADKPADPVVGGLLASILQLDAKGASASQPKAAETTTPKSDATPAQKTAEPSKPAEAPKPAEAKKVTVRRPEPKPAPETPGVSEIEETVRRVMRESAPPKPPVDEAPKQPQQSVTEDPSLSSEERAELADAEYAERKDPSKKGLTARLKNFYKLQNDFLAKKVEEEGDDYDPRNDPDFQKFLARHNPQFSKADRMAAREARISEETEARATKRAQEETNPRIAKLEAELRETRERPLINAKLSQHIESVAEGLPAEIAKFHRDNGGDLAKTREAYPEYDEVNRTLAGFERASQAYLELTHGVARYNPEDPVHNYISNLLNSQAERLLATNDPKYLTRDGKRFVHPSRYNPADRSTWTFSEADTLAMLKIQTKNEIKQRVQAKHAEADRILQARQRRSGAPASVPPKAQEPEASPRGASVSPAANAGSGPNTTNTSIIRMLGLGT